MEMDADKQIDKNIEDMEVDRDKVTTGSQICAQEERMTESVKVSSQEETSQERNRWEQQKGDESLVMGDEQGANQEGWPQWQQVRKNKRIRDNGTFQVNMGEQAQDKKFARLETKGTVSTTQNSFCSS